jgi:hypothetical protein
MYDFFQNYVFPMDALRLIASEPGEYFEVGQSRRQPVGHGEDRVREILDQLIGDRVSTVQQVEDFQAGPKTVHRFPNRLSLVPTFFLIIEQGAETQIRPDVWLNDQRIPI